MAVAAAASAVITTAALPNITPVAATSIAVPPCEVTVPGADLPALPGGSSGPVELSRTVTSVGTMVLSGHSGGWSYRVQGCRNDGAPVATISYILTKAPKSARWLVYADSVAYGDQAVAFDLALPVTERQFDRARKRNQAQAKLRLPKVKGTVYVTGDQEPVFSVLAKRVDGKQPTKADRVIDATAFLDSGDPFEDGLTAPTLDAKTPATRP